jgi:Fuc2NAc and GlcNAc transferase
MSWWLLLPLVIGVSFALAGWKIGYAVRRDLLDHPNERSSHTVATPRGGGVAIVLSFFGMVLCLYFFGSASDSLIYSLLLGGGLVAAISYWDDHGHISAKWRILVHFVAAGLCVAWSGGIAVLNLGFAQLEMGWVGYAVAAVFLVWLLNLYNFMDGIDGIAGVEAITVSLGAAAITMLSQLEPNDAHSALLLLEFALPAATLGFLLWNWPPAKIFMGDIGSGFLGYVLGVFALFSIHYGLLSLWSWLILLGVFIVDATITLMRRILRGERWYEAHRSHAYQHAAQKWKSHKKVVLAVLGINILWLYPLAWVASRYPDFGFFSMAVAMLPLVAISLLLNAGIAPKHHSHEA